MEIKVKTRAGLLAALKAEGFAGPPQPDAAKQWCSDNGVVVPEFDALWAKTVTIGSEPEQKKGDDPKGDEGAEAEAELAALRTKVADMELAAKGKPSGESKRFARATADNAEQDEADRGRMITPKGARHLAACKAYNKRAANGFGNVKESKARFDDADKAEGFGAFLRLATAGPHEYGGKNADREILTSQKTMITYDNTLGGALIPEDFQPTLISLKEVRGALRQIMTFIPMSRDTLTIPRRTGGVTTYFPGEGGTITASTPSTNNVQLIATKIACLTTVTSEMFNDSAISVSDFLAEEFAYAMANQEDQCGINGDGTSTYGGITGFLPKFTQVAIAGGGTVADGNVASLVTGTGNQYTELTLGDFRKEKGRLPLYADMTGNAKHLMHKSFYWEVFCNETSELGGVTMAEALVGAIREPFGYPIQFSQVMPRAEANSQVCCLLGDFNLGAKAGEVRNTMTVASSEHLYFNQDLVAIRGIERFAFTFHDPGNWHATEASRVPGPIVGIVTAAS